MVGGSNQDYTIVNAKGGSYFDMPESWSKKIN